MLDDLGVSHFDKPPCGETLIFADGRWLHGDIILAHLEAHRTCINIAADRLVTAGLMGVATGKATAW